MQLNEVNISPRSYQLECLRKAREGNAIIFLETGCGKTLIAAMLLKELSVEFSSMKPCVAIFLVPTVMLVQQQADAIVKYASLKVGQYNGKNDDKNKWDREKWESSINNLEVLVMTPQILLNVLHHAFLKLEAIKVLVFDECHHCQKGHPYAQIMEEYYFKTQICDRPKILGLTGSPVIRKGKSEFQCTQDITSLEILLDAKIVTVEDRTDLEAVAPSPSIEIKEYNRVYGDLHRLQLLMQNIHNIKAKLFNYPLQAMGLDPKDHLQKKKEAEGLERICRDLEYCIYELGLWFARHAAKTILSMDEFSVGETIEIDGAPNAVKKKNLRSVILECLSQEIWQGGYADDLELESLKPDLISNKVTALVDVLRNDRFSQLKCIVFVERVVAAKVLACFLPKILKSVRCDHIVGNHSRNGSSPSKSRMSRTLDDFRSGMIDLLVATNVAEEGLDIQDCCLVVHFDMPKTLRSFIQSRGRARVQSSHYVIIMDRTNMNEHALFETLVQSEGFVKDKILQVHEPSKNQRQRDSVDAYEVESTGAMVSTNSSVQLLYRYCSKLPSDEFYLPQPSFQFFKEHDGVKCSIALPSNACVRRVEGDTCDSEVTAKKAACLKACRLLHTKGVLTDYLLPRTSVVERGADTTHHSRNTKAATEELQETVIPAVWLRGCTSSSVVCLQAYSLSFVDVTGEREYASFALLLQLPLPEEASKLCETLQLRHGRVVVCKLEAVQNVFLDQFQVAQAERHQSILFSVLLDRDLEHSKNKEPPISDGAWYLLLPLKRKQASNPSEDPEIDWMRISKLKPFEDSSKSDGMTENTCSKVDNVALHFFNGVICIDDLPGLLVKTLYGKHLYCVIEMFADLTSESPFPNPRYKTYKEYFKAMYGHELACLGQHLIKARFLRDAHNFLLQRSREKGHCSNDTPEKVKEADKSPLEQEKSLVELPTEICRIEYSGFYDDIINAAVILPSVLHRLESILLATQFHSFLSSQFPEGSQISIKRVLEATTTEKCLDSFSLERLELLGDSFLKYAIGRRLFLAHEEADEGFLSLQRIQRICNSSLFTLGTKVGVQGYIRDTLFDPKHWIAPCHPSKASCDESKLRDLHGDSSDSTIGKASITCNRRHRWMQRKTVADVIEALIGAYLEDGGEHAALAFMQFIGLEVATNVSQIQKIQSLSVNSLSLISRFDIEGLEKLLSYSFVHKGLLIEAFTHASFTNHLGKCYQRLEFLGDSVLDFLITKHLYREFQDSKPGELTDLRSTIVSNESFSRIAVHHKLDVYLLENSGELRKGMKEFISYVYTCSELNLNGDLEGDKCSKVLADILESLCGAICVDRGFDLSLVWQVFEPLFKPLISSRNVRLHPVRELQELCQKNHLVWSKKSSRDDGLQCHYTFEVLVGVEVVTGTALSKDKRSAKRRAAVDALAQLKDLGYVHSCKGEAVGSKERKGRDLAVAKEPSDKFTTRGFPGTELFASGAGGSIHHTQTHTVCRGSASERSKEEWSVGSKLNEAQFTSESSPVLLKRSSNTILGATNISEPQSRVSPCTTSLQEPMDYLRISETFQNMTPTLPLFPTASRSDAGSSTRPHKQDHIGDLSEKFKNFMQSISKTEPQFKVETRDEEMGAASIMDQQAQNSLHIEDNWKTEIEGPQDNTPSNLSLGTTQTLYSTQPASTFITRGCIQQPLGQKNSTKICNPGGHSQHPNLSSEDSGPSQMETNGVDVRRGTNFPFPENSGLEFLHVYTSGMAMQAASKGSNFPFAENLGLEFLHEYTNDVSMQAASSKGIARASLYEACAGKRWKAPSFTCSHQEGPPHDKRYTYSAILQLPAVGQVECLGDPRRSAKEAMDSAATELLSWLASNGYL